MKIALHEMVFYGFHGFHDEERKLGQRFIVSFVAKTDPAMDESIQNLEDTLDYTLVYDKIRDVMENSQFHLLENCANSILDQCMNSFPIICYACVSIRKPSVPIQGPLDSVEVEMERSRS